MCESERKQRGPWDIIHQHRHFHRFESILLFCSLCCGVERETRVTLCLYLLLSLVSGLLKQIHRGPHNPRRTEGEACLGGENGSSSLKRKTKHQLPVWWKDGEDHMDGPQQTLKEESIPGTRMEITGDPNRAASPQNYHRSQAWWDEHLLLFDLTSLVVNTIPTSVQLQSVQGANCLPVLLPHSAPAWHAAISEEG